MPKFAVIALMLVLAACGTGPTPLPPPPTQFDLDALTTAQAATIQAALPTLRPTSAAPTLPPAFTPSVPPSETPTTLAEPPTETPPGFNAAGTLYYIFNGDSVAALSGDGAREELILVGGPYTELSASPDGTLLAYVAPGAGSAREVYISNRAGTYTQRISCLGMASMIQPTWRPDGQALAFVAAPLPGAPADIYTANIAGSGGCPSGNAQRMLVPVASVIVSSPAWDNTLDKFFYSNDGIFGVDLRTNTTYALTNSSGFGPDFGLKHNPANNRLAFLRTSRNLSTNITGGNLYFFETSVINKPPLEQPGGMFFALTLRWSQDGRFLLIASADTVWVFDSQFGSSLQVVGGTKVFPSPAFSPDARSLAYVDLGEDNVPQVFVISRGGGTPQQITFHTEGTITDLVWLAG